MKMPLSVFVSPAEIDTSSVVRPVRLVRAGDDIPPFAAASGFTAGVGEMCLLPSGDGSLSCALVGLGDGFDPWALSDLPLSLPAGVWSLDGVRDPDDTVQSCLAWALGAYRFDRYRCQEERVPARMVWPAGVDHAAVGRWVGAIEWVRDLVNTPAEDMGPSELEDAARGLAQRYGASLEVIVGEALSGRNYPAIYMVGRASPRAPRLIDIRWGDPSAPRLTLVGKGVCFDTGGLDLKPSSGMRLMKKDMGGAAHALALASLVMDARLPVRLRVLVPAVDNAVAGNAMRPGDILRTRKGLTVEISNTDAEGRLILADALAEGDSEKPDLMIDFATLTGAARVALGPELPALFSNQDTLAADLVAAGQREQDPLWHMPLWDGYRAMVESRIADLDNAPEGGMAGAITAALFLQAFVSNSTPWAHIDLFSWNQKARPGRPVGGEAMTLKAIFSVLQDRFVRRV
ncbi:leucyl aminopeptidase family protein [Haematospirillum jordaniae]|nr:leucyl aminopeptidase family protein [Haematospirillum jordaniae]NKD57129.1 leucyl aminopeptidase family protein [Haematospirillum jordaniae]NKD59362.1 leucyl aminopeptidase family protein [Haematospirillum jordaniae]NKD79358.1 leucyl aminopeptidase family protein [Haematospirillum jordaniae]NKD81655.1 leucyl aminopeptidase family protein [Haematospirillum jordaniae]